jgi:hypothetical protein
MQPVSSLAERLRECCKLAGGGAALARIADIPRSTLETYLTGANAPKPDRLGAICHALGVNGHWLLLGKGEMLINNDQLDNTFTEKQFLNAVDVLKRAAATIEKAALTTEERILVDAYRNASPERREIVLDILNKALNTA